MTKKKVKNLTAEEAYKICIKNCNDCQKCPLFILQSDKHIYCALSLEIVRTFEKEVEIED